MGYRRTGGVSTLSDGNAYLDTHIFAWPEDIPAKPLRLLIRDHVAAEPQAIANLSRHAQSNVVAGLNNLIAKEPDAARAFAFNVAAGTPVVIFAISLSRHHGGGSVFVDKSPCLTATSCQQKGYWLANLNRHLVVEELEALQGIPQGRFCWSPGVTRYFYAAMIGNGFTVGVVGRIALRLLKTIGALPAAWPDAWADESQAWTVAAVGGGD